MRDQFLDVGTQCTSRWWNSLLHEIVVKFSGKETNRTSQGKINKWTQILDEVGANTRASNSGETLSDYCIVSQIPLHCVTIIIVLCHNYHCIVSQYHCIVSQHERKQYQHNHNRHYHKPTLQEPGSVEMILCGFIKDLY